MIYYKNLKPFVRVIEFLGGTGNGKTEFALVCAESRARKILIEGIGNTNSTLTERLMVFTTEYTDKMLVAVKHNEEAFSKNYFTEIVSKAIAKIVKKMGKSITVNREKSEEELKLAFREELSKRNNVKAILSLLTEEQVEKFIYDIVVLYHKYDLHQHSFHIYNAVKNKLNTLEVKENSKKFLAAIQSEVERTLDIQEDSFKTELWKIWEQLNGNLTNIFFSYFNKNDLSDDGYYFKNIDLDNPDTDFVGAMFTANNMQVGEKLSLEVLCSEIVIYVPMNSIFADWIKLDQLTNKVFRDSYDNIVFGSLDTRGLYHSDNTDDENTDYCSDLLYKDSIDGIVMIVPLEGDTNEKKIGELYKDVLKNFNKQVPIFMVHNKLDLFITSLLKQNFDDPLSIKPIEDIQLTDDDIKEHINQRVSELDENLKLAQAKAKKSIPIKSLSCYLKRDKTFPSGLISEYNVFNVYKVILHDVAALLEDSAHKIQFKVKVGETPIPTIDRTKLAELVHVHVTDNMTVKKVFTPGILDIALSIDKTPHGNAYNALRRRLKNGEGYTSNIDEKYFYNCQSFSINFAGNLRNFVSSEFLHSVIFQALKVKGVEYNQEHNETYMNIVESYIIPKKLVSILLYEHAIQEAEREAFSFKSKFQNFLQNSMAYFNLSKIDEQAYADAIEMIVLEAANRALDLNVTFK